MALPIFTVKDWHNKRDARDTPISAAALQDLEDRLSKWSVAFAEALHLNDFPNRGTWNASTNTPTLANGIGTTGDFYVVIIAGIQDLGLGSVSYDVGDHIIYDGVVWQKIPYSDRVLPIFNVKTYGDELTGTGLASDDLPAARAALNALIANDGGVLYFPTGTYIWASTIGRTTLSLPDDCPVIIRGEGREATTIQLTEDAFRAFDMNCYEGDDALDRTFRDIALEDLTVDGGDVGLTYSDHGIIGSIITGGGHRRANFKRIRVSRVRGTNFRYEPPPIGGPLRAHIGLDQAHDAEGESACVIEDILIEDVQLEGGNTGVVIMAQASGEHDEINVTADNIIIRDFKHDTGNTPTEDGNNYGANIQIGQNAAVGRVRIDNCEGVGSDDVGIEVDNGTDVVISNSTMIDSRRGAYLVRNFRPPLYPDDATVIYRGCVTWLRDIDWNDQTACFGWNIGIADTIDDDEHRHIIIEGCRHYIDGPAVGGGVTGGSIFAQNSPVRRITVRDFEVRAPNLAINAADTVFPSFLKVAAPIPCRLSVDGMKVSLAGSRVGGANVAFRFAELDGALQLELNDIELDYNITGLSGAGEIQLIEIGRHSSQVAGSMSTISGWIRRLRFLNASNSDGYGVLFGGTEDLTIAPKRIVFEGCDFAALSAGSTEIYYGGTSNTANVKRFKHIDRDAAFVDNSW